MKAPETVARPIKIGGAVLGDVRPAKSKGRRPFGVVAKMAREVEALARHRANTGWTGWVRPLADLMAPTIGVEAFVRHVLVIDPDLTPDAEEIAGTAEAALADRTYWTATSLGKVLELSRQERKALGITTIRATGMTRTEQAEEKRRRDREAKRARRRDSGAVERSVWIAESVAEEARRLGVSRMTVYRRRRADGAACDTSVARKDLIVGGDAPVTPAGAAPSGARPARSPAADLARVVIRSTGVVPAIVTVEPHEAWVVFPPRFGVLGQALADHLGGTLAEFGFPTLATFDGRSGVHLTFERAAA